MKSVLLSIAVAIAFVGEASADSPGSWCNGNIPRVYTHADGGFYVIPSFRNDWIQICSVKEDWKGVSPQVCNVWVNSVISGMLSSSSFTMYYAGISNCAMIPHYGEASPPGYVMVNK